MSRTRKIVLVLSGITLALLILGVIFLALLFSSFSDDSPTVRDNSVLVLRVRGAMPDYVPEDPFVERLFGADTSSLASILSQIKKAKVDKRIGGILLEVDFSAAGWAKADELRDAITDFRQSGKPIYAYIEIGADKEYYIATACDKIFVPPAGDLFIDGLSSEAMFFRGSLDKLGIYPDFAQIGKYKNAPDQYTRREMSDAQREVTNAILDDIYNRIINTIASSRRKTPDEVRTLIDTAPHRAPQALQAGLIDGTLYREQVERELKKRLGYKDDDELRTVSAADYRRVRPESLKLNTGERIAVIYASGGINSGSSDGGGPFGDQSVGSDTMVKALNDARDDKTIRAIVLRVDSPGGSAYASDLVWQAVEEAKKKKPVVVSMSDVAASGGYYIATNANRIVAHPSTITGSIGIYAGKPVMKGFYDWIGVSSEYTLRGKNAGMYRETEPFTPEERAKFESMIGDFYYNAFLPKVAQGRGRTTEYVDSIAQGRVWTGTQGRERGLVDEFGGMERAIEVAKELAKIPADKSVRRVVLPYPRTFLQRIFGGGEDEETYAQLRARQQQRAAFEALPEDVRRALRYAAVMDRMKRGEVMAMMPFELRIE
ncbi:MAG: signal peptide peptidase SppA [Pyrinomonadaceae bacterium]